MSKNWKMEDRRGFCLIGNAPVIMGKKYTGMTTLDWMVNVLGLSTEDAFRATRGYLKCHNTTDKSYGGDGAVYVIQFFTGNYATDPRVDDDVIDAVMGAAEDTLWNGIMLGGFSHSETTLVRNGCTVGKEGETWKPKMKWNWDGGMWTYGDEASYGLDYGAFEGY